MSSSWENVKVDNSNMRAYVSAPDNAQRVPAIIVVQGQTGVDDFVEFSDMVAREGFIAAAPDLYHRDSPECKDDAPTRRMRLRDATVIVLGAGRQHRYRRFLHGWTDRLSHGGGESRYQSGGHVLRRRSVLCVGRWRVAVRAHEEYSLPDNGPLRRRR